MRPRRHPITEHPGDGEAVIEPARLYARRPRLPERAVLCFFNDVIRRRAEEGALSRTTELAGEGDPIQVYVHGGAGGEAPVAVCFPGIAAPFAASTLEELVAQGVSRVVCCGGAGVLDGSIPPGAILVPVAALRDEGTSYHYQRRGRWSRPHPAAVRAIEEACHARGLARRPVRTWTTDGVYRETRDKVRRRRAEGCLAVEMEAAAFFAVARFRRIRLGQILYAGDDVGGPRWRRRSWNELHEVREALLDLALDAVRRMA